MNWALKHVCTTNLRGSGSTLHSCSCFKYACSSPISTPFQCSLCQTNNGSCDHFPLKTYMPNEKPFCASLKSGCFRSMLVLFFQVGLEACAYCKSEGFRFISTLLIMLPVCVQKHQIQPFSNNLGQTKHVSFAHCPKQHA